MILTKSQTILRLSRQVYIHQFNVVRLSSSNKEAFNDTGYKELLPPKKMELNESEKDGKSKFRKFTVMDVVSFLSQPIDLSPKSIKNWFNRKNTDDLVEIQENVIERREAFGIELGTAVFILQLNGAVRFKNHKRWTRLSINDKKNKTLPLLPPRGTPIEEIDLSNTPLMYDGIDNLCGLRELKTLIFDNCKHVDDVCIDKVSRRLRHSLVTLRISNCPNVTEKGLTGIPRLKHLETLYLSDLPGINHPGLLGLLLEEEMPRCKIVGIDITKDEFIHFETGLNESEEILECTSEDNVKLIKKIM